MKAKKSSNYKKNFWSSDKRKKLQSDEKSLVKQVPDKRLGKSESLRIPSRLERLIEQYIETKTGKSVDSPATLERIRQSILVQKAGYWDNKPHAKYERGYDVFAYLAYQAPGYIVQFRFILQFFNRLVSLPKDISLLDLGTGPGVVPLAVIWYLKEKRSGTLTVNAIEQSGEFLEAMKFLVSEFSTGSSVRSGLVHHDGIQNPDLLIPDNLTLITCQNVLAELSGMNLADKVTLLMNYASHLSDDGVLILVEPAELRHSTQLRVLQKELQKCGLFILAPCIYPHGALCNPDTCWSFVELPLMKSTRIMDLLSGDNESYRFKNTDIKFSFSILTKKSMIPSISHQFLKGAVPLNMLEDYNGEWVSVVGTKMSMDIGNREFAVYLICDGSGGHKVYLIVPRSIRIDVIKPVRSSGYGEILRIENVRVRWNSKKNSFNLLAGMRTRVSAMNK